VLLKTKGFVMTTAFATMSMNEMSRGKGPTPLRR